MPDFKKLKTHVDALSMLLNDPQPGLATWVMMVGDHWKQIAFMWEINS